MIAVHGAWVPARRQAARNGPVTINPSGQHQQQVRRADQGCETDLDPETEMPEHVDHAANAKQHAAKQREAVAGRQHVIRAVSARLVAERAQGQERQDGEHPGVEHGMPGREERLEPGEVPMGPGVKVGTSHQPSA